MKLDSGLYSHFDLIQERYLQTCSQPLYRYLLSILSNQISSIEDVNFSHSEWECFSEMALQEGVAGLVYHTWRETERPQNTPAMIIAQLGTAFTRNKAQYEAIKTELMDRIAPAFKMFGLRLLVTKGAAIVGELYPDPGTRPMVDADCLVREADLAEAARLLGELGYREEHIVEKIQWAGYQEHHREFLISSPLSLLLELHTRLTDVREDFFDLDMDWFFSQTMPFLHAPGQTEGDESGGLFTFTPATHLLHLAVHLMVHHGEGASDLIHFYDIHRLLLSWAERIDWEALASASRRMNLDYAVWAAIYGCAARFGTPVPEAFSRPPSGRRVEPAKKFIDIRRKQHPDLPVERYLVKLANRPLGQQMAAVFRFLFPQPDYLLYRYRLKPALLWPLAYPLHWRFALGQLYQLARRRFNNKQGDN